MKRVVVTGGAGFIGSNLCEKLLKDGIRVVCLDNFLTSGFENIKPLYNNYGNFFQFNLDINNFTLKYNHILFDDIDTIFNLACPASPCQYQKNPINTLLTSVVGVKNMLDMAKEHKCRVIQASTSEIYGEPKVNIQSEDYYGNVCTTGPRSCYDEGKRAAETLFSDYRRLYNLNTGIIRIFNTYGPKMRIDDGRVVSNFICQALQNKDITIYGDGKQTRCFCYIDDMVDVLIKMGNSNEVGPINVGNDFQITIVDLAKKIIELTKSKSELIWKELPKNDPIIRKPDLSKVKKVLDWKPTTDLDTGLLKTIEYFKSVL